MMDDKQLTEEYLDGKVVFPGKIIRVEHWHVRLPNGETALREIAAKEPAFRCRIYRFGEKFMVSPFSSDNAGPCAQFIGIHAERFPGMWTYTAR